MRGILVFRLVILFITVDQVVVSLGGVHWLR